MTDRLACVVQNLSDVTADVDTELVDENGVVIDSSTYHLGAGVIFPTVDSQAAHLGAYCHFSVSENAGEVRGYALIVGSPTGNAHLVFPAFAVGGAGAVLAITPAVSSVEGDATVCAAQNLDNVARMVDAELVDTAGTVLDDGSVMVQPGHVQTVAGHTEAGTSAVCRFTFVNPTDRVRGFITRFPSGPGQEHRPAGARGGAGGRRGAGNQDVRPAARRRHRRLSAVRRSQSDQRRRIHALRDRRRQRRDRRDGRCGRSR